MRLEGWEGIGFQHAAGPRGEYLLWTSESPLRTLNTSPWGGGFGYHSRLINRQVDKLYRAEDPLAEMRVFLESEAMDLAETAGMLTAARVSDFGHQAYDWCSEQGTAAAGAGEPAALRVSVWATAGLGNRARAGLTLPVQELFPGTINCVIFVNGRLTDSAMVNAVITATEAKTAALQDLGIYLDRPGERLLATGTTTDAVLIAATGRGRELQYAGTATQLGYLIGKAVYEAVSSSARKSEKKPD